ncbi:MAG: DMT family transporter [Oscillospiraceae bacterium]|nr:DMT family transporter [Oscillospiraceae bacterium]
MDKTAIKSNLMLVTAALIWGFAFTAQSLGMEHVGPMTFTAARSALGAAALLPYIFIKKYRASAKQCRRQNKTMVGALPSKKMLLAGFSCGTVLFVAVSLQQYGLKYTTVGNSGFLTALYVIIVPILGIFLGRKAGLNVWIGVAAAFFGVYLLSLSDGLTSVNIGDVLSLLCAFCFSVHILLIDKFAPEVDNIKLSSLQFAVTAVYACIAMFIFEKPAFQALSAAWLPIAYTGVLSSGVAYTLQIISQKNTHPVVASLLCSLESVFALLGGVLILKQKPASIELAGCALVFAAIIVAQIPIKKNNNA